MRDSDNKRESCNKSNHLEPVYHYSTNGGSWKIYLPFFFPSRIVLMKLYSNFQMKSAINWILGKALSVSVLVILFIFFQLHISRPKFHRNYNCPFIPAFDSMGWSTMQPKKYQNFLIKFLQCTITMWHLEIEKYDVVEIFCKVLGLF